MVTILEPRTEVSVESIPPRVEPRQEKGYLEWRYSMPFAGVKYYSFCPEPRPLRDRRDTSERVNDGVVVVLAAQLIDERVILL